MSARVEGGALDQGADAAEVGGGVLERRAEHRPGPGGRRHEAEQHRHRRRLAGAVGADEAGDDAGRHVDRQVRRRRRARRSAWSGRAGAPPGAGGAVESDIVCVRWRVVMAHQRSRRSGRGVVGRRCAAGPAWRTISAPPCRPPDDARSSARTRTAVPRGRYRRLACDGFASTPGWLDALIALALGGRAAAPARARRPRRRRRWSNAVVRAAPDAAARGAPAGAAGGRRSSSRRAAALNAILGGGLFAGEPPPFASLVAGVVAFYSLGAHADDRARAAGAGARRRRAVDRR